MLMRGRDYVVVVNHNSSIVTIGPDATTVAFVLLLFLPFLFQNLLFHHCPVIVILRHFIRDLIEPFAVKTV